MSLGRTGRTNHAKGGRPPKRRTVVIHGTHRHSGLPAAISSDKGLGRGCALGRLVLCIIVTYSFLYLQINIPNEMSNKL